MRTLLRICVIAAAAVVLSGGYMGVSGGGALALAMVFGIALFIGVALMGKAIYDLRYEKVNDCVGIFIIGAIVAAGGGAGMWWIWPN